MQMAMVLNLVRRSKYQSAKDRGPDYLCAMACGNLTSPFDMEPEIIFENKARRNGKITIKESLLVPER